MLTTHVSKKKLTVFDSKVKSYILGIEINFFYSIIFQPVHYQKVLIRKAYLVLNYPRMVYLRRALRI